MSENVTVERWDDAFNHHQEGLTYTPVANFDATNGEFWVNAFREGYFSRAGGRRWYEAYLSAPRARQDGVVKNAGMWTRGIEAGVASSTFTLGTQIEPDYWLTGREWFDHATEYGFGPIDIVAMAFFIDVSRPDGEIVRLWLSRQGRNYTVADVLDGASHRETNGSPTSYLYASESSPVFADRPTHQ